MATWDELKAYIHQNYKATDVSQRAIEMVFSTADGRSQMVFVTFLEAPNGDHWASIDSPIGREDLVNVSRALRMVEDLVCGGLAHLLLRGEDVVTLRHAVPLQTLDADEFVQPLLMVTSAADAFEQDLTGYDAQ
jgi:hypothetical protein